MPYAQPGRPRRRQRRRQRQTDKHSQACASQPRHLPLPGFALTPLPLSPSLPGPSPGQPRRAVVVRRPARPGANRSDARQRQQHQQHQTTSQQPARPASAARPAPTAPDNNSRRPDSHRRPAFQTLVITSASSAQPGASQRTTATASQAPATGLSAWHCQCFVSLTSRQPCHRQLACLASAANSASNIGFALRARHCQAFIGCRQHQHL